MKVGRFNLYALLVVFSIVSAADASAGRWIVRNPTSAVLKIKFDPEQEYSIVNPGETLTRETDQGFSKFSFKIKRESETINWQQTFPIGASPLHAIAVGLPFAFMWAVSNLEPVCPLQVQISNVTTQKQTDSATMVLLEPAGKTEAEMKSLFDANPQLNTDARNAVESVILNACVANQEDRCSGEILSRVNQKLGALNSEVRLRPSLNEELTVTQVSQNLFDLVRTPKDQFN